MFCSPSRGATSTMRISLSSMPVLSALRRGRRGLEATRVASCIVLAVRREERMVCGVERDGERRDRKVSSYVLSGRDRIPGKCR